MIKKIKAFLGLTYYTSEADLFLASLAHKYHQLTKSQQAEIEKHKRIVDLRDKALSEPSKRSFWDKF